ncbi:MAG: hypothetical protein HY455_03075 [Parcubacteria group bacterium]|nr:hypothetical protein [Parcubacteria group bacterium]
MSPGDQVVFSLIMAMAVVVGMVSIWGYWIWIGKDGYMLIERPGFFRFWFVITPRYFLGMKTGMENTTR